MELNQLFALLAKTGDSVPLSELKSESEVRAAAEWSPSDVDENGLVSKLRCHSVPDANIDEFRGISDVRKDFIDRFFDANKEQNAIMDKLRWTTSHAPSSAATIVKSHKAFSIRQLEKPSLTLLPPMAICLGLKKDNVLLKR